MNILFLFFFFTFPLISSSTCFFTSLFSFPDLKPQNTDPFIIYLTIICFSTLLVQIAPPLPIYSPQQQNYAVDWTENIVTDTRKLPCWGGRENLILELLML